MIFCLSLTLFLGQSVIIVFMKKRYRTVNDYYREIFGEKIFKLPIDAGLIVPTVMAQWLMVAVPLYGIGVWGRHCSS